MYLPNRRYPTAIISRPKLHFLGEHWGVQLADGSVIHLSLKGVERVSRTAFACGKELRTVRVIPEDRAWHVLRRAEEALRYPPNYRILDQNCEVFANRIAGEKPESPQVQVVALLAVIALVCKLA